MHIQKVNKNQLRIFIDINDLRKNEISINDFMSSSNKRRGFLWYILKRIQFDYGNNKLILESFSIPSIKSFIIIITKTPYKIFNSRYKKLNMNTRLLIKFSNFEELCFFCNSLFKASISSLFFYKSFYFLNIEIKNIFEFKNIIYTLKEFTKEYKFNYFIDENAQLIIKNNAIEICKYLFVE